MRLPALSLRNLFYGFYGLAVTVILLYFLFPAQKFRQYCEVMISGAMVDGNCRIGQIAYRFPKTVRFDNVVVESGSDRDVSSLTLESVDITNNSFRFWRELKLSGKILSGNLEANLEIHWEEDRFTVTDILLERLDLGLWGSSEDVTGREFSGLLAFSGEYSGGIRAPLAGKGTGVVDISGSTVELLQPILSLRAIDLETVKSELRYEDGVVYVTGGNFSGKELAGDFTGVVKIFQPLSKSVLTIGGQLDPQQQFLENKPREQRLIKRLLQRNKSKTIPFKVGGTLQRPTFRFAT